MGQPVFLVGSTAEVGTHLGLLQRTYLVERVERTLRRAETAGLVDTCRQRAEGFAELLTQCTPHWFKEAEAMAAAAGIDLWPLLAINCLPPHFWGDHYRPAPLDDAAATEELVNAYDAQGIDLTLGGDCTTFFALPGATLPGETIFHKNRDERDEVQCLYIKQIDGRHRFVGGGDMGNLGTAHLHTEDFWVGANNTGSPVPPAEYEDNVLNDCHVLRYLAERCASLDDIVPAMEELIANRWLGGGGYEYGMILIFADAARALIVEATSRRLAYRWYEEEDAMDVRTNHFLLPELQEYCLPPHRGSQHRLERARELWFPQNGYIGIPSCGEIGRDREGAPLAICRNPSDGLGSVTVSTSTATISTADDSRCQTHFRNCHPSYTPALILTPLDRVSDSDLVSGAHNQEWRNYRSFI